MTRRTALAVFGLVFVLFASWALATPLFGAPDEHTHVIRATSVVRGEILGKDTATAPSPQ